MKTGDVREAAFIVSRGHPILRLTFDARGFALVEFPPEARAEHAAYQQDAPAPARSLLRTYKLILRRIDEDRAALRVHPREVASRG